MLGGCSPASTFHLFSAGGDSLSITNRSLCNGGSPRTRHAVHAALPRRTRRRSRRSRSASGVLLRRRPRDAGELTPPAAGRHRDPRSTCPREHGAMRVQADPIRRGAMRLTISGAGAGPRDVDVLDVTGRAVAPPSHGMNVPSGGGSLVWDGTTDSGARVPAGITSCACAATPVAPHAHRVAAVSAGVMGGLAASFRRRAFALAIAVAACLPRPRERADRAHGLLRHERPGERAGRARRRALRGRRVHAGRRRHGRGPSRGLDHRPAIRASRASRASCSRRKATAPAAGSSAASSRPWTASRARTCARARRPLGGLVEPRHERRGPRARAPRARSSSWAATSR